MKLQGVGGSYGSIREGKDEGRKEEMRKMA